VQFIAQHLQRMIGQAHGFELTENWIILAYSGTISWFM